MNLSAYPILDTILPVIFWIAVAGVAWVVLRFLFKTAVKIFFTGCAIILGFGALVMLVRWLF